MTHTSLTLLAPDDWHCHLRDDPYLSTTVPIAAKQFRRVIVMPNLATPVATLELATQYYHRILKQVPKEIDFTPLMTLYLTDQTTPAMIAPLKASGIVIGCKLYPANVTTHSNHGVSNIAALYPVFEALQKADLALLIHGEVNDPDVDIFDREAVFIDRILFPLTRDFPALKIVLEHITSRVAVQFIQSCSSRVAATITPHHLYADRNALLVGGLHPHYYCLPILKRREDQEALIQAAISGSPQFFIGTDSAPHAKSRKESSCGCAGIFHPYALCVYAQIFEQHDALEKLEGFTSRWGPLFYGLPLTSSTITLQKSAWTVPQTFPYGEEVLCPFLAGETLLWEHRTNV